ncbi:hypothetical protein DEU56DRAFT_901470 [Suillus clintonianus]|uniref:uncharacterized protein n=1 Tax=Suillus clintonianus TaxID=1904413 RepID=UPI001B867EDF|nr:uncharacterized protein DEU56DRAFT_901470 [Suillus clintonianus]KAG2137027.1 hypothetical protein DEU56DRAFT_901470 [Suillus clintonianus]
MQMVHSAEDITAARRLQFLAYLCTSTATFWTYDYICSIHEEWEFLLRSRWTKVKALYVITRSMDFTLNENPNKCQIFINIYSCFGLVSVTCAECLFVLRTCALWTNNRMLLVTMLSTLLAIVVVSLGTRFISTSYIMTSTILGFTGCYRISSSIQFFMPFLLFFVFELGLVSLTLIRAIQSWRLANGPLYVVLIKHNIFYYACGLLLSAVNVLMPVLSSNSAYHTLLEDLQFFLLAILATRMHMHLWQVDRHVHGSDALVWVSVSDTSLAL